MPEDTTRTEPVLSDDQVRLNIEQQKKRARELQRALKSSAPDALRRAAEFHPKARNHAPEIIAEKYARLSDAQLILARELGVESWPKLVRHIERLNGAREAIAEGAAAPDARSDTIHVRCGSDIRDGLKTAGFAGDFIEFADPYCHGPVPAGDDLPEVRAQFISGAYGLPIEDVRARQSRETAELKEAMTRERIILWFEHDSYDQLILARILALLAEQEHRRRRSSQVELICIDRFPVITRFNGLGQLSPAALRMLWQQRQPVTPQMLKLGTRVWDALRQTSPESLFEIARTGTPALPQMAPALLRHLQELPGLDDGLGLTERLTLKMLAEGPMTGGQLFRKLQLEREPLPYLGDLMYWSFLANLNKAEKPPIKTGTNPKPQLWPDRKIFLTPLGKELVAGRSDFQSHGAVARWVGGVEVSRHAASWRWDRTAQRPVLKQE
ncbi:DUF1835 domain-containing protein [Denitrobaculum tricleocarpae]|uniref:DUF1835 domain-containing protein n=1 Tax=Denitrobaculum tricleocarpae TaxID=2591009 RepID=A0A545TF97_9PROT|nr:DUF1835 domain-containing protein [Denitrobaculum tricleocarpae]TQV75865.1 DUF1835 domain-containing protein [Denitrobaculum tricleocarpae]